jgi:hypothetical protein
MYTCCTEAIEKSISSRGHPHEVDIIAGQAEMTQASLSGHELRGRTGNASQEFEAD